MKAKIYTYDGFKYVKVDETENPEDFRKWLDGQSCPVIPNDEAEAAYFWDYEKWVFHYLRKNDLAN